MKKYFVTGIGTDVGKSVIAAILTEALEADYWKPVQAGDLDNSDTIKVKSLVSNTKTVFHQEAYQLTEPMSPHAAAKIDEVEIDLEKIQIPETENSLVIEGAGGLMVPLNDKGLIIDLIEKLNVEVVLVSQNYLGSINHTLLSIDVLKARNIKIAGLIFNGDTNEETESYILKSTGVPCLGRVSQHENINATIVSNYKIQFKNL